MNLHEKINYVELPAKDLEATKAFFQAVFGWSFVDYGPEYTSFSNKGWMVASSSLTLHPPRKAVLLWLFSTAIN